MINMGRDGIKGLEAARMDKIRVFEDFKMMCVDWLRFYRANMWCLAGVCELGDPDACSIPDECEELERVWSLWIETLIDEDKLLVI